MNDSLLSNDVYSNKIEVSTNDENIINSGLYMIVIFIIPVFCIGLIFFVIKNYYNIINLNIYTIIIYLVLLSVVMFYLFCYCNILFVIPRIIEYGTRKELSVLYVYFSRINNILNLIIIPVIILFLLYCLLKQRIPYI